VKESVKGKGWKSSAGIIEKCGNAEIVGRRKGKRFRDMGIMGDMGVMCLAEPSEGRADMESARTGKSVGRM